MNLLKSKLDINWDILDKFSNFPFVRHSFFYIAITPIVATLICTYFTEYPMPFNLLISYIGSVFFLLARILTILKLPVFIKNIPNYKTYINLKLGRDDLDYYSGETKNSLSEKKYYDYIYTKEIEKDKKWRIAISILFLIGLLCFIILFFEGAVKVKNTI